VEESVAPPAKSERPLTRKLRCPEQQALRVDCNDVMRMRNYAVSGYHSNELSSVNTLHERKLCSSHDREISLRFRISDVFRVY
jgi:hypothetical protein